MIITLLCHRRKHGFESHTSRNMENKLIGIRNFKTTSLNEQYQTNDISTSIEVYLDKKKKDIKINIMTFHGSFNKYFPLPKKTSKRLCKKLEEAFDKPIDTSNYVTPDNETLKNELIINLVCCELLNENAKEYTESNIKAGLLYSILYSSAPKNPQCLDNYNLINQFDIIYKVLDNKSELKNIIEYLIRTKNHEQTRKIHTTWKTKKLKEIIKIIPDFDKSKNKYESKEIGDLEFHKDIKIYLKDYPAMSFTLLKYTK